MYHPGRRLLLICLAALALAGCGNAAHQFDSKVPAYLALRPAAMPSGAAGRLKGKAVVLVHSYKKKSKAEPACKKGDVDEVYFALPDNLMAKDPADVGSVVWVDYEEHYQGYYYPTSGQGKGGGMFYVMAQVTVIDVKANRVTAMDKFQGTGPVAVASGEGEDLVGGLAGNKILSWLTGLPHY